MISKEKLKGHCLILIVNILFAINVPVSKSLLPGHINPEGLTIMRMTFACVLFWVTSLFVKRQKVALKDLGLLFICALCGVGLNQSLFIEGLNKTSPLDASIIATAVPIFVMLLAALILKEPITRMKAIGVLIGITGGLSLILGATVPVEGKVNSLGGDMMIVTSSFVYSVYLVLSRPLSQRYSAVTMMKWMFLFSSLVLFPFTYKHVLTSPAFNETALNKHAMVALGYVLLCATFIPYLLIPMAMKRIRPTTVSMYNYVQPIVASFIAVLIGQDSFSFYKLGSASLVFIGVYLVTQSKSKEDIERENETYSNKKHSI